METLKAPPTFRIPRREPIRRIHVTPNPYIPDDQPFPATQPKPETRPAPDTVKERPKIPEITIIYPRRNK